LIKAISAIFTISGSGFIASQSEVPTVGQKLSGSMIGRDTICPLISFDEDHANERAVKDLPLEKTTPYP
jgi:hypothetical protein